VRVLEIHIIAFLDQFHDFAEAVHIQLADEGLQIAVPEEARQHFVLEFLGLFDEYLGVAAPTQVIAVLLALRRGALTSRMW